MGFFDRLFKRTQITAAQSKKSMGETKKEAPEEIWSDLPFYIPAAAEDYSLVSVIATAIAAGDSPESEFVIKSIQQRNPEVKQVSLIAASIAAQEAENSSFVVKRIAKKK